MSQFNRYLWTGLVLGLAACGDDVTVTNPPEPPPPPVPGVTAVSVAPDGATINVGATLGMTAAATLEAGAAAPTWAWSSSSTAIATVAGTTANATVTGVAVGSAGIRATATVGTSSASGVATVTVSTSQITPATVSINSITCADLLCGAAGSPVDLANTAGATNIRLNLDRGGEKVTKVQLLVDNVVVSEQAFATASAEAAAPELAVEELNMPWNSAEFNATTGVAKWLNGAHTISAKVITAQNAQGSASPSVGVTTVNSNRVVLTIAATKTATDAAGKLWVGGDVSATGVPVLYTGGTVGSVTFCPTVTLSPATHCQQDTSAPYTALWLGTTSVANGGIAGVEGANIEAFQATTIVNGSAGPSFTSGLFNVDNLGPTVVASAFQMPRVADGANIAGAWGSNWINGNTSFSSYHTSTDAGVAKVTSKYYYIAGSLPSSCGTTGMTEAATGKGADVPATTLTSYRGRIVSTDAMGNIGCASMSGGNTWGVDVVSPTATAAATNPADGVGYTALPNFAFDLFDNASGFTLAPMANRIMRATIAASTTTFGNAVWENTAGTDKRLAMATTFNHGGAPSEGYYQAALSAYDQAGNLLDLGSRVYQFDATPAQVLLENGPLGLATTISWSALVSDNQDLKDARAYRTGGPLGAAKILYGTQAIGQFGLPYLIGNQTLTYTVSDYVICLGGYSVVGSAVGNLFVGVRDFAQATYTDGAGVAIPFALATCTAPFNTAGLTSSSFGQTHAAAVNEGSSLAFTVDLTGAALTSPSFTNPFARVELWVETAVGSGEFAKYATTTTAGLSTTNLPPADPSRTYTWNFSYAAPSVAAAELRNYLIVGVTSSGMGAVLGGSFTINNVP